MTKDDMDLLKGFPLSIEQKERLLDIIKGTDDKTLIAKVVETDEERYVTINGNKYALYEYDGTYYINNLSLHNYVLKNNYTRLSIFKKTISAEENKVVINRWDSIKYELYNDFIIFIVINDGREIRYEIHNFDD